MQNIYVVGHFGGFNAGDEAMLGGLLGIIPEDRNIKIKYKNNVHVNWGKNVSLYKGSFISFIKLLKEDDLLILCGGTHFHDDYTVTRLLRHWLYLLRINFMFRLAKKRGAKRFCLGNGFGPVNHVITKIITKQFAGLCDILTVRDSASAIVLRNLNARVDLIHSDLAGLLYLQYRQTEKIKQDIVGISLTSLTSVGKKKINDEQLTRSLADSLVTFAANNKNVMFRLFVIRSGERESDYDITSTLKKNLLLNNIHVEQYVFNNDLKELIEKMSECKIFVASRFHSAILSSISESKLIILSYHRKLVDFAMDIALPGEYVFNLQDEKILNRLPEITTVIQELYTSTKLNYNMNTENFKKLKQQLLRFL